MRLEKKGERKTGGERTRVKYTHGERGMEKGRERSRHIHCR